MNKSAYFGWLRCNNILVNKFWHKLHHASDAASPKSLIAIKMLQLCRHHRHNLLTIFSPLVTKNLTVDSFSYMPIHHRQLWICKCVSADLWNEKLTYLSAALFLLTWKVTSSKSISSSWKIFLSMSIFVWVELFRYAYIPSNINRLLLNFVASFWRKFRDASLAILFISDL